MTGIARRLTRGPIKNKRQLAKRYNELLKNKKYLKAVETATSDEANVQTRLDLATRAFASTK
jgi:hypothetical protein